jgi:multidrug transporter EmrE-like cation transporter
MPILLLIVAFLLNSAAHIFLKIGATAGLQLQTFSPIYLIRSNYIVLFGAFLFGLSAVFYFMVLRIVPVSVAYPVVVISSFILINFFAFFYLNEHINIWQLFGYALLLLGLVIICFFRS